MTTPSSSDIVRHPDLVVILSQDRCTLLRTGHRVMTYRGAAADVVVQVIEGATIPRPRHRIVALNPQIEASRLERLLDTLLERGMLVSAEAASPSAAPSPVFTLGRVVVGVSGAVEAARLTRHLDHLVYAPDTEVQVVLTAQALRFVLPEALTNLYGIVPWTHLNERRDDVIAPHVALGAWAETVLLLPATAHLLHRLASGTASDLLSLIAIATRAPVIVAPAMNEAMWQHPAVRRNVRQIVQDGAHVVLPGLAYEVARGFGIRDGAPAEPMLGGVGVRPAHVPRLLRAVQTIARSAVPERGAPTSVEIHAEDASDEP